MGDSILDWFPKHEPEEKQTQQVPLRLRPEVVVTVDEIAKERGISRNKALAALIDFALHMYAKDMHAVITPKKK